MGTMQQTTSDYTELHIKTVVIGSTFLLHIEANQILLEKPELIGC